MPSDDQTSIRDLRDRVSAFAQERDWDQFHSPKNLSMALAVEVAELLELFQWKTEEQSWAVRHDVPTLSAVREEIGDIGVFLLNLCNRLDVDLASAITDKLEKNAVKYPVQLAKGKATKYTDLQKWTS